MLLHSSFHLCGHNCEIAIHYAFSISGFCVYKSTYEGMYSTSTPNTRYLVTILWPQTGRTNWNFLGRRVWAWFVPQSGVHIYILNGTAQAVKPLNPDLCWGPYWTWGTAQPYHSFLRKTHTWTLATKQNTHLHTRNQSINIRKNMPDSCL